MGLKVQPYQGGVQAQGFNTPGAPRVVDTMSGLARGMQSLGLDMQKVELRTAELEAEEQMQAFVRDMNSTLMTGDDPYYGTRGKDSVHRMQPTIDSLQDLKRSYLERVKNPHAHRALSRSIDARLTSEMGRIQQRALQGQDEWDTGLAKVGAEQAAEQISLYINDPVKVRAGQEVLKQNLRVIHKGQDAAVVDKRAQNANSKALAAGIAFEIERSPGRAQGMLDQYRDQLEADDLRTVEGKLQARVDQQRTLVAADAIRQRHPGDLGEQLKLARETFKGDAKLQDELKRRLTNDYNLDETVKREARRANYERLADDLTLRNIPLDQLMVTEYEAIQALDASQLTNLQALDKQRSSGEPPVMDWGLWSEISLLPKEEQAKLSPGEYFGRLDNAHRDKLVKLVKDARDPKGGKEYTGWSYARSKQQMIDSTLKQIGISKDSDNYNLYVGRLQEEMFAHESREQRDLNPLEMQTLISGLALRGELGGTPDFLGINLYDNDVRMFQLKPEEVDQFTIEEVPTEEREKITTAYVRKYGKAPSESEIRRLYTKRMLDLYGPKR